MGSGHSPPILGIKGWGWLRHRMELLSSTHSFPGGKKTSAQLHPIHAYPSVLHLPLPRTKELSAPACTPAAFPPPFPSIPDTSIQPCLSPLLFSTSLFAQCFPHLMPYSITYSVLSSLASDPPQQVPAPSGHKSSPALLPQAWCNALPFLVAMVATNN